MTDHRTQPADALAYFAVPRAVKGLSITLSGKSVLSFAGPSSQNLPLVSQTSAICVDQAKTNVIDFRAHQLANQFSKGRTHNYHRNRSEQADTN